MAQQKRGAYSFVPGRPVCLRAWASVAGKKEAQGPMGALFDYSDTDTYFGQPTWEKGECFLQQKALTLALEKAGLGAGELDLVFSGDLLNQCISSSFALRNRGIPSLGQYGACSTMAQSLLMGAMAISSGAVDRVVGMTSSHFAASERQFRYPLGYGGQRTPTAQWTVTASGAVVLESREGQLQIDSATIGTVKDLGITDANNMGAAMAPAAVDTILHHFADMNRTPQDFDLIVTGDLGRVGRDVVRDQLQKAGFDPGDRYNDCGTMIFDMDRQDVHAGGSGCGCSAAVLCGRLLDDMKAGRLHRLLFCGTGALLSPTSTQQGESIPGICHAVSISARG